MLKVGQCKALARKTLLGKYALAVGAQILAFIFPIILALLCTGSLVLASYGGNLYGTGRNVTLLIGGSILFAIFLVLTVLSSIFMRYGLVKLFLNICRAEKYGLGNIWYPFTKGSHPFRVVAVEIVKAIIVFFFSSLLALAILILIKFPAGYPTYAPVICAIVVVFLIILLLNVIASLFLADLIIIDKPDTGVFATIAKSFRLMRGHKLKAIWFMLFSFLFWNVLMAFCNLTGLWISPYILCSKIFFYMSAEGTIIEASSDKEPEIVFTDTDRKNPDLSESSVYQSQEVSKDSIISPAQESVNSVGDPAPEGGDQASYSSKEDDNSLVSPAKEGGGDQAPDSAKEGANSDPVGTYKEDSESLSTPTRESLKTEPIKGDKSLDQPPAEPDESTDYVPGGGREGPDFNPAEKSEGPLVNTERESESPLVSPAGESEDPLVNTAEENVSSVAEKKTPDEDFPKPWDIYKEENK